MALAQKMQMRQGQALAMTPQLQQAIKLLQFSSLELAEYLDTQIESNPLLLKPDSSSEPSSDPGEAGGESLFESNLEAAQTELDAPREDIDPEAVSLAAPLQDCGRVSGHGGGHRNSSSDIDFEGLSGEDLSLRDILEKQLQMAGLSPSDRMIALVLIDATDEDGFMRADLTDLAGALEVEIADIEAVLNVCQGFDPTGIMARNLPECLALQLREKDRFDPAMQAMLEHLDLVACKDLKRLQTLCGVDQEDLHEMIAEIKELTPKPGRVLVTDAPSAIRPDILVSSFGDGTFAIELNPETLPRVLVDRTYYTEVSSQMASDADRAFIAECHAGANWLIKGLEQRAKTILKVAREIVRQQDGFFMQGVRGMRPMTLKMVADAINMHESTVSRVTSNKYMATERGVFELKYFFSQAIPATRGGTMHAAEAVRDQIRCLIAGEQPDTIYSDDQIVEKLRSLGIEIARRTVAKYRESLKIPSSVQRRRLALNM